MRKLFQTLSWVAGTLLNLLTGFTAVIYLFGGVVWMHAPAVPALLLTLAMTLPCFGVAWGSSTAGWLIVPTPAKTAVESTSK
jgi:hypothetical protein